MVTNLSDKNKKLAKKRNLIRKFFVQFCFQNKIMKENLKLYLGLRMNLDLMLVLTPTFKLGINDAVLLAEGDYLNITCFGLLVIKFQYPFKIFTACHNRIFMFCSAKVTWFMQNASEAIECLPAVTII